MQIRWQSSTIQIAKGAVDRGIELLKIPYRAPKANSFCERFLGSVRRECLDHFLIFGERHLQRVLRDYVAYFNQARPHQGLGHRIPVPSTIGDATKPSSAPVQVIPILGGLHHRYQRAA